MNKNDPWAVRAIVILLGVISVFGMGGLIALLWVGKTVEAVAVLVGLVATPIGALASMLSSTRGVNDAADGTTTTPVTIENKPSDPVPVTATEVVDTPAGTVPTMMPEPTMTIEQDALQKAHAAIDASRDAVENAIRARGGNLPG